MPEFNYQLYSSREFPPVSGTLRMLHEAGYSGVEGYEPLFAGMDDSALSRLKGELDDYGLAMPTAHLGLDLLEGDMERVRAIADALGIEAIYCPHIAPERRPGDASGWKAFGERLEAVGEAVRQSGHSFGWHNHDFEFTPLSDGSLPIEHVFADGSGLEWEADIAWVARAGADPFAWIDRFADRITAVHVKDIAAPGENADEDGWADVGDGTLPWRDLMQAIGKTRVRHYVMEHDKPADDRRFATRSIDGAKALSA
ncbi:sugar phosphate isomerase/epimerase family protein [Pararhizobium mangrovi]|uniref:Sugar phosphate isomerase/epimerase n=1 Tax=Pararhizobium mangrovi TaxID=2590452 RepID=A0A506UHR1_9HYPH|nr:sugar phosphate isomerase/epimerase [Pararhizobium mangrovi]TPW32851.1 sugar phosphate isomerase/epimerase [Pararhizobium mangrovi]